MEEDKNFMPEFVVSPVMERVMNVIGKLSMYPSQVDPTHLKRGAAAMLDEHLDYQPELPFDSEGRYMDSNGDW